VPVLPVPVLLYDGHCGFCRREVERLLRLARPAVAAQSFHEPGILDRYPGLSLEACLREIKLVHADGRVEGGAAAVAEVLRLSPGWRWLGALLGAPGVRALADTGYRWVARNRYRLARGSCPDGTCAVHRDHRSPP
jgi:predicted DCC family thiol-disulfide oxidoreductase YuxK